MKNTRKNRAEDMVCPVCGYYCIGAGGIGCIDKPLLFILEEEKMKRIETVGQKRCSRCGKLTLDYARFKRRGLFRVEVRLCGSCLSHMLKNRIPNIS